MPAPDVQPLAAGISALLLVASTGWWLLSTPELIDPGQPTWKGADIVRMQAAVPEISPFEHFYVNHDNPFVPYNLRVAEARTYNPKTRVPQVPPRPVPIPPPRAPVVVVEQEKPKLVLPRLTREPINAPIAYGLLASDGEQVLIARMSGDQKPVNLKPGDQLSGWTLISIDSGNLATFLDPQGIEHRFAIGQGDLAVAQDTGDAAKPRAPATNQPGGPGKAPTAPGKTGPPKDPLGVDGPIPRPPPREERRRREPKPDTPQQAPTPAGSVPKK